MRAWQIQDSFGIEHLALKERKERLPDQGEVAISLLAASLNYRDLLVVKGQYNPRQALPLVPASDGAGVVHAVGEGVAEFEVGQAVIGAFAPWWRDGPPEPETIRETLGSPHDGTLREQIILPAQGIVRAPPSLSFVQSSTLPCAGVTAYRALFSLGHLQPGQTVLCLGTGGVSIFALQLAKAAGAHVIITSSSDEKLDRARALGADETVNYRDVPKWGKHIRKLTGGVDLVVEVGGAGTLAQSLASVRPGGTIALIGVLAADLVASGQAPDLTPALMNQIRIQGVYVGPVSDLQKLTSFIEKHDLVPVVDNVFPWSKAPAAFTALAEAQHFGKIVVQVGDARQQP